MGGKKMNEPISIFLFFLVVVSKIEHIFPTSNGE